ncbi:MAG: LysM peptidoglycan-binding domain-containing protein [Actinomycetota bacterium]
MRFRRYKGRHLAPSPNPLARPAVAGTATAILMSGGPAAAGTHTVAPGETLSGIAARYGTNADALARANGIGNPNMILAGARLRVPGGATSSVRTHEVTAGETLSSIASRYGTSIDSLARVNRLADPNMIVIGQRLRVPGAPAGAAASTTSGDVETLLESHAAARGLDGSLVKAVAWQESGWRQKAKSSAGAIGVMQVMPTTADYVNEVLGTGDLNVRETEDNIQLGVTYLDHVIDGQGDERKGLAAYYSGPGNVGERLKGYQRSYVDSVEALKDRF